MGILSYFFKGKGSTASIAKERLQLVIAHERSSSSGPAYLPLMKQDIINVIKKYAPIDEDGVDVQMQNEGRHEVLELNITLSPNRKG